MFRWVAAAIFTIVILVIVGAVGDRAATDTELAARIGDRLANEGIGWAEAEVTGREVRLVGGAATDEERAKAATIVRSTPGVRSVDDRTETLAAASPYKFVIERSGDSTVARGVLPNSRDVGRIQDELAATFVSGLDTSGLSAASGAPVNFLLAVEGGISAAELLQSGSVSVDETAVRIEGVATDQAAYDALTGGGTISVPQGYTVVSDQVTAPAETADASGEDEAAPASQ